MSVACLCGGVSFFLLSGHDTVSAGVLPKSDPCFLRVSLGVRSFPVVSSLLVIDRATLVPGATPTPRAVRRAPAGARNCDAAHAIGCYGERARLHNVQDLRPVSRPANA